MQIQRFTLSDRVMARSEVRRLQAVRKANGVRAMRVAASAWRARGGCSASSQLVFVSLLRFCFRVVSFLPLVRRVVPHMLMPGWFR